MPSCIGKLPPLPPELSPRQEGLSGSAKRAIGIREPDQNVVIRVQQHVLENQRLEEVIHHTTCPEVCDVRVREIRPPVELACLSRVPHLILIVQLEIARILRHAIHGHDQMPLIHELSTPQHRRLQLDDPGWERADIGAMVHYLDVLTREIESPGRIRTFNNQASRRARKLADAMSKRGYTKVARFWKTRRLTVNLQLRLYVEAVLFSMGKPWNGLVSGFKPLRGQSGLVAPSSF